MQAVARLAYEAQMLRNDQASTAIPLKRDDLLKLLPSGEIKNNGSYFINWLIERAGILTDRTDGTLQFAHLSFQEFLAARHLQASANSTTDQIIQFKSFSTRREWWETLRLAAALIQSTYRQHADILLDELVRGSADEFWLSGVIFADGLGSNEVFEEWARSLVEHLAFHEGDAICSSGWRVSQQRVRRERIVELADSKSQKITWVHWVRVRNWLDAAGTDLDLSHPRGTSGIVIRILKDLTINTPTDVGIGRVLTSMNPFWPIKNPDIALLNVWPGSRKLAGTRMQSLALMGSAEEGQQHLLLRGSLSRPLDMEAAAPFIKEFRHKLACHLPVRFNESIFEKLDEERNRLRREGMDSLREGYIRDVSIYAGRMFFGEWRGALERIGVNNPIGLLLDACTILFRHCSSFCDISESDLVEDEINHFCVEDFLFPILQRSSTLFGRDLRDRFTLRRLMIRPHNFNESIPDNTIQEFFQREIGGLGRGICRATLAHTAVEMDHPAFPLLKAAAFVSLHPDVSPIQLDAVLAEYPLDGEPLWPALARQIARRSTSLDRELLVDRAMHPEKCEPPLSWGLQYVVRGDVIVDDPEFPAGRVCRLEEFGLGDLAVLEEMPPELELDA
jgi:hypothetical protein